MIDSVLKGTGNSRFLKSAVPAGTSWADALAMLQAGTFPIDFNGINTEGFQQVGTPLNKANLLKDATAAQIGLPPSTTPDGMFQALGNTGELHVWRKTVVVGSYYIGPAQDNYGSICKNTGSASFGVKIQYSSKISVDASKNKNLIDPSDMTIVANNSGVTSPPSASVENALRGKFVRLAGIPDGYQNSELRYAVGTVFYCPENISCLVKDVSNNGNYYICLDGVKNVIATTENVATYPVSTNPNAYQEGDDAKAAGYVVGEVKTGSFQMAEGYPSNNVFYETANSINVGADGAITLNSPTVASFNSSGFPDDASFLGKFVRFSHRGASGSTTPPATTPPFNTTPSEVVYIPASATITHTNGIHAVDRYQPVTGYAAIPAGTTIEYLGKLGDKARVQVVSYVGTGTYGSENDPITLTFPFAPKYARFIYNYKYAEIPLNNLNSTGYTNEYWGSTSSGRPASTKISKDGKTLSWYSIYGADDASNSSGTKYSIIIVG